MIAIPFLLLPYLSKCTDCSLHSLYASVLHDGGDAYAQPGMDKVCRRQCAVPVQASVLQEKQVSLQLGYAAELVLG